MADSIQWQTEPRETGMISPGSIFIVESDAELALSFADQLHGAGFRVRQEQTGISVVDKVRHTPPDLLLVDSLLPGLDGVTLCKQIREFSSVPIIMVVSRVDEVEHLIGRDLDVDDYLYKPVTPMEVVARVRAVLHRLQRQHWSVRNLPLHLQHDVNTAYWQGTEIPLSRLEFRLFELLITTPQRTVSRQQIMRHIYEDRRIVSERSIDSHVKNLRRKLINATGMENPIRPVYGIGYRVVLEESKEE